MQQPLVMRRFYPQSTVRFWTPGGAVYDVTGDALQWTTQRSTDSSAGTWTLTLVARQTAEGDWAKTIPPMSYCEIRAGFAGQNPLPIRMRGFVDSPTSNTSFPQRGGPQRSVTINGRDFTKLLLMNQILYLFGPSSSVAAQMQSYVAGLTGYGLSLNYGIDIQATTCAAIVEAVLGNIVAPAITAYQNVAGITLPAPLAEVTVPDSMTIWSMAIQPYTGPFWNLLTYLASAPFGEVFWWDAAAGPQLEFRIAPFTDPSGAIVAPAVAPSLPDIIADGSVLQTVGDGTSDNEVYNYFFTMADSASAASLSAVQFMGPSNPILNAASQAMYGLRPLQPPTPWVSPEANPNYVATAGTLNDYLASVYGDMQDLVSGTVAIHGDPALIPGRYVQLPGAGLRMYIQTVQETFDFLGSPQPSWQANLSLVRGRPM